MRRDDDVPNVGELVARLTKEYRAAAADLAKAMRSFPSPAL